MTLVPHVDEFACSGHGDCALIAPGVFQVDDVAVVIGTGPREQLVAAVRGCPAGAITLIDDETGQDVVRP
jgi:ferredoxin